MTFKQIAKYFESIEEVSSRLKITAILAALFKKLEPEEVKVVSYLIQGRLVPLYKSLEFGMANKLVIKAILETLSLDKKVFNTQYKKTGDLGITVENFKRESLFSEEKELAVRDVYDSLLDIARASGNGSQTVKANKLSFLIKNSDPLSCRYLVRIIVGRMRLGFSAMTILDAFSWMMKGDKSLRKEIERFYHVNPDLGLIGELIKKEGLNGLKEIKPRLFTPIIMMRAERLPHPKDIIAKIGRCIIEPKYDGFRIQVHYQKKTGEIKLYSRNLEEVGFMYPDLVAGIRKEVNAKEAILEGEAIGFNPVTNRLLPFQETVQRKRKYGIDKKAKEVPLKLFTFELLYLDGKNLISTPFIKRRKLLEQVIQSSPSNFSQRTVLIAPKIITNDEKKLVTLFNKSIAKGLEGVIAKKLDGVYEPGARDWNWIKYKRSYSSKIEDTIDCLVMGYDLGKGKRTNFGIGAFLVGIYDPGRQEFLTIAKIGTGLTDDEWRRMRKECDRFKIDKKPPVYNVDKQMNVDVWVNPGIVVEIKADEITRSSVHTAGRKMRRTKTGQAWEVDKSGFALRFPRLEKFRSDKRPEEVTTLKEMREMFIAQKTKR